MDKFLKITFLYFWVSFLSRLQVFSEIYLGICQVFLTSVVMCKKEKKGEGKKKSLRAFYSFSFKCIEKSILQYKMFRLYYKDGEGSFCLPKRRRDEGKKTYFSTGISYHSSPSILRQLQESFAINF